MKGVVFNLLEEMVEQNFGIAVWDSLLEATNQDGIYVSTETYPDEMLAALVVAAHEKSGIPVKIWCVHSVNLHFLVSMKRTSSFLNPA